MALEAVEIQIPMPWGHVAAKTWGHKDSDCLPVLAIHGSMDNASTFARLIPLLPQHNFFFVSIDLPGHGRSSHLPPGMTYLITDYILVLRRICDYFSWKKIMIIGHSYGAFVASFFTAFYPDEVVKLVMIDVVSPRLLGTGIAVNVLRYLNKIILKNDQMIASSAPLYTYDEALNRLKKGRATELTDEAARTILPRSVVQRGDKFSFALDRRLVGAVHPILTPAQMNSIYGNIKCNVLIVIAEDSRPFVSKDHIVGVIETLKISCKSFQLVFVPGNHDIHLNTPEVVSPHITKLMNLPPQSRL